MTLDMERHIIRQRLRNWQWSFLPGRVYGIFYCICLPVCYALIEVLLNDKPVSCDRICGDGYICNRIFLGADQAFDKRGFFEVTSESLIIRQYLDEGVTD